MTAKVSYGSVEVGTELPAQSFPVTRATLVQYAGASGDFNPIHWNEKFALEVGLPDVIAHGMFTMAEAVRVVTDWVGDPGAVVDYGVRFTKPVVVPNDDKGALIEVSARSRRSWTTTWSGWTWSPCATARRCWDVPGRGPARLRRTGPAAPAGTHRSAHGDGRGAPLRGTLRGGAPLTCVRSPRGLAVMVIEQ